MLSSEFPLKGDIVTQSERMGYDATRSLLAPEMTNEEQLDMVSGVLKAVSETPMGEKFIAAMRTVANNEVWDYLEKATAQ